MIEFTYFDQILPMLRHIQGVLTDNDPNEEDRQWHGDRSTNKLLAWTPEMCGLRIQLSNNGREIAFYTFLNLVVIWGIYEQALEQLQPRHRHRPQPTSDLGTFRDTVNRCTNLSEIEEILGPFASTDGSVKLKPLTFTKPSECGRSLELHIHSIEFREHAGTLQAEDIYWWMQLTVTIMQYAQWLTHEDLAFGLFGEVHLTVLLELTSFSRKGKEFYVKRMEELARMEELERVEGESTPLHTPVRIKELELIRDELARSKEQLAPIPWSP